MAVPNVEKVNILLVDDQPARLLSYEAILTELGHTLVRAGSGVEGLQRLMERDFALVLLDVSMPGMDGFETASLIHQHPRYEKLPIIFVTGVHVTELDRLKGYKLGAVDYVYIPIVPEILRSKVSVLVELYCKRRDLQSLNATLERANRELAEANAALQASTALKLQEMNRVLENANSELARANSALRSEIEERKRAETALLDADRRKDEFLAMLAHELRNPLAPIRNAVRILQLKDSADNDTRWAQGVIERQVTSLTRLVDDLLDVSRITRGKINLEAEPIDLKTIVMRAVETSQPFIDARRHRLEVNCADGAAMVSGDATRLSQVIANLLNNAAKYTPRGGVIRVQLQSDRDEAVVSVKDSGIGIAPEELSRVFEMFTQLGTTPEGTSEGLGIGLALVHRLIEMHGGIVSASSEGREHGSEFSIRLPLLKSADTAAQSGKQRITADSTHRGRRILVVDDHADSARSLATSLQLEGHSAQASQSARDALQLMETYQPDIILLDLGMPEMDGYEAARRIRARPEGQRIVLIALTGWGKEEDRRRTADYGFDAHLTKPFDRVQFYEVLGSMESRRAAAVS